jgi:mono/diheme cytochrome c family protein
MKHRAGLILFVLAAWPLAASAQDLTPQQREGRRILTQNCNLCHLPQGQGSATYGPRLSKSSTNGDDNLMREVINNGLVKMPGWRHSLSAQDINNVIAYVRTLPDPPAPAAAPRPAG